MFSLCPHCQFLLARDPRSGRLPEACPKCGGAIVDDNPPPPAAPPADESEPPDDTAATAADATPHVHHARRPRRRRTEAASEDDAREPATPRAGAGSPQAARDPSGDADADADADVDAKEDDGANAAPGLASALEPAPGPDRHPEPDPATGPGPAPGPEQEQEPDAATTAAITPARPARTRSRKAPSDTGTAASGPTGETPAGAAGAGAGRPPGATPGPAPRPPEARGRRVPSFLQARATGDRGPRRESTIVWPAIGMLVMVLAMQLLLADRERLAMDAAWRPTLARLCGVFGCSLPPWREPQAFTMLSRDVRAHPQRPGTLRVTASFRNDARWPQPWPTLLLTLSDLDGRVAGARAFVPADYVDADATDRLLEPGQAATVTLDVVEPSPRIVAFTFDFR